MSNLQNDKILVSILCTVYNHEPYLRQCLDGFVMQKTNFAFEAIVHDDASTDASAAIIREYAEKYPNIIKPIYEEENQYSKWDGSITKIMQAAIYPTAKYIAICEGDDYWIDSYKLQKQVDFLEKNNSYGLVFSDCKVFIQSSYQLEYKKKNIDSFPVDDDFFDLLLEKNVIPTLTVLIRKELYLEAYQFMNGLVWDRMLWIYLSNKCKFKYIEEPTGVYRILKESASHSENNKALLNNWDRGTRDLLNLLYKMNLSEFQVRKFVGIRATYLLFLSYQANNLPVAEFYFNLLRKYKVLHFIDYLNFYSVKIPLIGNICNRVRTVLRHIK